MDSTKRHEALEMLRNRREQLHMTPREVARAAGLISSDYYLLFENLRLTPKLDQLPKLARALQYDVRSFCLQWLHILHPEFAKAVFGPDADPPRSCGDPPDRGSE
jgi:transcriptional regulator with XRE-family HTH domain